VGGKNYTLILYSIMLKVDLHLHTLASKDSHNTILEYINRAKELKMKIIGISDHGPSINGGSVYHFQTLHRIPKVIKGIRILKGIEANIINRKGDLDIDDEIINQKLDYVLANFHFNGKYIDQGEKTNTEAMILAIKSGKINILCHPFLMDEFEVNIERVSAEACSFNVLLEVNTSYLRENKIKKDYIRDLKKMIAIAKSKNKKVIVGSDAHNIWELADDSPLKKIAKEIGLDKKIIINNYPKELLKFLRINN